MKYFLRYSERIQQDLERGCSYHYTGLGKEYSVEEVAEACNIDENEIEYLEYMKQYVQVLPGICAFELDAETEEEAIEEAEFHNFNSVYNVKSMPYFHVLTGDETGDCPEGCLIENVELIYSNEY